MKSFNFIPAAQVSTKEHYRYEVTLSKNQTLFFSKEVIEIYQLNIDVFKFYLDEANNTLGWMIVRSGKLDAFKRVKGQGIKKLNINTNNGIGSIDIKFELKKMCLNTAKITTKKHSVNQHKLKGLLEDDNKIDYIELDEYKK
jgi:hypothetical protein